jgi:hypothetical protein
MGLYPSVVNTLMCDSMKKVINEHPLKILKGVAFQYLWLGAGDAAQW